MTDLRPSIDTQYEQWCEDFRSINDIFWRLPVIAMTVTGGLAVAISSTYLSDFAIRALLAFNGVCNVFLILAAWRIRHGVMESLLTKIHSAEETAERNVKRRTTFSVLWIFTFLFGVTAAFCFYSTFNTAELFRSPQIQSTPLPLNTNCTK